MCLMKQLCFLAFLTLMAFFLTAGDVCPAGDKAKTMADKEFTSLMADWAQADLKYQKALVQAKTLSERKKVQAEQAPNPVRFAERCLKLAQTHPGTTAEFAALCWAAGNARDSEVGKKACDILVNGRIASADLAELAQALDRVHVRREKNLQTLAPTVLERVKKDPEHPRAAWLLTWACATYRGEFEQADAPKVFAEAADLITAQYAHNPDITNFCECLGSMSGGPPWAGRFETHLRNILKENRDRRVRCAASFALASVVQAAGESRQAEAEELYQRFQKEFDGKHQYYNQAIEKELHRLAKAQLDELKSRGLGKLAPEIDGLDLDGRPMKLSEYRGKVVLLSYWATWCFPCMKLVPHERALATRLEGKPFVIVGINSDTDAKALKNAITAEKITWRSFQDKRADKPAISDEWRILGFPTLYLIDHDGIIRKRWIGAPPLEELDRAIERLVEAAGGGGARKKTGFLDKVYKGADGREAKYVVFVPHGYDGKKVFPAILFLHGAGRTGTDGRDQVTGALGQAIQKQEKTFAFVTIFPQSHLGSWQADTEDGKRAVAILDEVTKNYTVDKQRVYLTGLSMGGEGTWALAAAHSERWAAIVPLCGGGDPKTAAKLKDIPCWCFHGDADKVVEVDQSRLMIRALKKVGGRPLYHEYPGVGHNCWDLTYANPDLYEWLLQQKLKGVRRD
jgi:acetyl esterase/lipase